MFLASTTPQAGRSPSQVSSRQLSVHPPKSLPHAADLGGITEAQAWHCSARLMSINFPAPLGPNLFVLGEPVLHKYYTVFDWHAQEVGFGLSSSRRNVGKLVRQGREGSLHQESRCGKKIEGDLCLLSLSGKVERDRCQAGAVAVERGVTFAMLFGQSRFSGRRRSTGPPCGT